MLINTVLNMLQDEDRATYVRSKVIIVFSLKWVVFFNRCIVCIQLKLSETGKQETKYDPEYKEILKKFE